MFKVVSIDMFSKEEIWLNLKHVYVLVEVA